MTTTPAGVRKLVLSLSVLAAVSVAFYIGGARDRPLVITISPTEPATQSYSEAVTLLNSGKSTPRAIALLKHSIALSPNNPDYHGALACAYTDRAAYLYRALEFNVEMTEMRKQYWIDLFHWELNHINKSNQSYYDPRPVEQPYHAVRLKDDSTLFRLTPDQTISTINSLSRSAEAQWSDDLALTNTPSAFARANYYHARATCVFACMREDHGNPDQMQEKSLRVPSYANALTQALQAIKLDPANAVYWQSTGDIADEASNDASHNNSSSNSQQAIPDSRKYYLESLKLQPKNDQLWLELAHENKEEGNFNEATADLRNAVKADPDNGCLALFYAYYLFKTTHYEQGGYNDPDPNANKRWSDLNAATTPSDLNILGQVEIVVAHASKVGQFNEGRYSQPVPVELASGLTAVSDDGYPFTGYAALRDLARNVASAEYCQAMHGKITESLATLSNLATAVSPMTTDDHFTNTHKLLDGLVGVAIEAIALKDESKICDNFGSKAQAVAADKYYSNFLGKEKANRKIAAKLMTAETDDIFDSY